MIGASPRQLQVFAAIAAAGNVRSAAERLHLSQPAASMALAELERQLGQRLFDRAARRLQLNEHGRRVLPLVQELLQRFEELGRVAASPGLLAGELRLGTSNTVGNYLVGDLLGGFVAAHPQVTVKLHVDNTAAIVQQVCSYEVDLGCVEGEALHPQIERMPWREDHLCVCAPATHPLARRRRLRADDFAGARWILREAGSATRSQAERVLAQLPTGESALELDQAEAIKQAVIAGLGLALLPAVAVEDARQAGRLVVLRTPFLPLARTLSLIIHRGRYRGPLLDAFLQAATARAAR